MMFVGTSLGAVPTIRYLTQYAPSDPVAKKVYDYIAKWGEANKDKMNLVQETIVGDDLMTKVHSQIASDSLADMFNFWGTPGYTTAIVNAGLLLSMDEYWKESKVNKESDFDRGFVERCTVNGVKTTMPSEGWVSFWIANKTLFDKYNLKIPTTLDELVAVGKVFNQHDIVPFDYGSKGGNPSHLVAAELFNQLKGGTEEFRNLTKNGTIDTPNMKRTLQTLDFMRENNLIPKDTMSTGDWGPYMTLYNERKAAILQGFTWMLQSMLPEIANESVLIDPIKMPGCAIDVSKFVQSCGDYGTLINKRSWNDPSKHAALLALADFVGSAQFSEYKFFATGQVPARKVPGIDYSKSMIPLEGRVLARQMPKMNMLVGLNFSSMPGTKAFSDFHYALDEFSTGSMTAKELIDKIDATMVEEKSQQ
jgi:raffinose/stachyose/melibiose transport system substrate-binding protein